MYNFDKEVVWIEMDRPGDFEPIVLHLVEHGYHFNSQKRGIHSIINEYKEQATRLYAIPNGKIGLDVVKEPEDSGWRGDIKRYPIKKVGSSIFFNPVVEVEYV